jgi:hypothetical protein
MHRESKKKFNVSKDESEISTGFVNEVSRQEIAGWACETASQIICLFIDRMRDSKHKSLLENYKGNFVLDMSSLNHRTVALHTALGSAGFKGGINGLVDKIVSKEITLPSPKINTD